MERTETRLEVGICENCGSIPVIVVAAGNATRMGGVNKQTLEICGKPVIARTLEAFERSRLISRIILVVRAEDVFIMQSICNEYGISKVSDITEGGEDRHKSVLCGISRLSADEKCVLIHDGARPFVNDAMIYDCIEALKEYMGCLCAVKVSDTVKKVGTDGTVKATVDRSDLYLAQTPQGVRVREYSEASKQNDGAAFTDDASVLEMAGYSVKIVNGSKNNIKITTPEDIGIAEGIIERGAL